MVPNGTAVSLLGAPGGGGKRGPKPGLSPPVARGALAHH
jgi:hypothetical protein